jgi:hypothetical protein
MRSALRARPTIAFLSFGRLLQAQRNRDRWVSSPANGELRVWPLPPKLRDGATLAISIEPPGGSPIQQPTGPVVFVGTIKAV